jgi:hypothetical protein
MSDELYHSDVVAWSEQQADLLRRAARGERVNGLDWTNLIEEIEDVGVSQRTAVESLLRQALVHLLKIGGWPASDAAAHWAGEAVGFLADASGRFTPSMRRSIDLERLYRRAHQQVRQLRMHGVGPQPLLPTCPLTLDDLLSDDPAPVALAQRLAAAAGG